MRDEAGAAEAAAALRRLFLTTIETLSPRRPTAAAIADLDLKGPVVVLALGKAAIPMAEATLDLGEQVQRAIVVAPDAAPIGAPPAQWTCLQGSHPVPDARSERAGRALLATAAAANPSGSVLALVSGGGSALAAVPAAGLTLDDKARTATALMDAGVPIHGLNCVRRHLSAIKGGRLAAASPATVTTLVISDVIGDALHEVASGPTVPDPTTAADARHIIADSIGLAAVPEAVARHLDERAADPHTRPMPRPGDRHILVSGMMALARTAGDTARSSGIAERVRVEPTLRSGLVDELADELIATIRSDMTPELWLLGGEPTVHVPPGAGHSGRAQHLALLCARGIDGMDGISVLVAGSDGIDGASSAAGAVVDGTSWSKLARSGFDGEDSLRRCDAAAALATIGAQVVTGPTGVNHADLIAVYRWA